jgi:beta-galactosidase
VDYFSWAADLDIISNDDYLITDNQTPAQLTAMSADLMRSLSPNGQWLLMEHSPSAVNWQPRNPAKAAGQMRRNSLQHIARGSAGAMFFQWRAARAGAEKFHSAMLPHAGIDTARWREVLELGADVAKLGALARSTARRARVAILFDWNSWWAAELDSHPSVDFSVLGQVQRWHRELWSRNVGVDFVHPRGDLAGYSVVLLPALYLMDDDAAGHVAEFVASGGTLLAGYFSGIVDENDHIRLGGYPGAIRNVLGITVEEFDPLPAGTRIQLSRFGSGTIWSERAVAGVADVLAEYSDGNARGSVAVSHHGFGTGHALYVGTELQDAGLSELFDEVLRFGGVDVGPVNTGVEIVQRFGPAHQYSFVINHSAEAVTVPISGKDLLTGATWPDSTLIPAGAVVVLEADRTN